ncbi:MAG TPA: hypothetical protein PKE55_02350 [Kiritimatiellia bacterium]|nr:hypothetical protein [Kiritimatiellia bacterium]
MNVQETNFDDILSFYFYGTDARKAMGELERKINAGQEAWLKRMLRDYREDPVYNPDEIAFRDSVDDLMTFCNVIEYAATGRLIGMQPSSKWSWAPLAKILRNIHVQKYYMNFYPDRLPQLLLKRLDGEYEAVDGEGVEKHCLKFMELDRQFVRHHRSGCLLKLLDDFTIGGVRFSDVTSKFETPDSVLESLLKADSEKDVVDEAMSEFGQFLSFCGVLVAGLDQAEKYPLLQAEAWARYAYWFEIIELKMKRRLGRTLDKFVAWKAPGGKENAVKEIQEFVVATKTTLNKLFSNDYGTRIDSILRDSDDLRNSFL